MSIEIVLQGLSTVVAGASVSAILSTLFTLIRKRDTKQKDDNLTLKIEKASKHLLTASEELSNLQTELSNRIEIVNQLKEEARISEEIVSLNKDQVEAIRSALNVELEKDSKRNFWISFLIGFLFFILGAITSYIIQNFL